jgi:chromosome segregation ATPase
MTMMTGQDAAGGGIMRKISVLRELLLNSSGNAAGGLTNIEATALQQARYEEKLRLDAEARKRESVIQELQSQLGGATKELEEERSLRKTLETTYEALAEHKKVLTIQLEAVSTVRNTLEDKKKAVESTLEKERIEHEEAKKLVEKQLLEITKQKNTALEEVGSMEANLLVSKRLVEEVRAEKAARETELEKEKASHREIVQGYMESSENLKFCLKESEEACKQAVSMRIYYGLFMRMHNLVVFHFSQLFSPFHNSGGSSHRIGYQLRGSPSSSHSE